MNGGQGAATLSTGAAGSLPATGPRPVDYLRLSITDRCNFRCRYCMPPQGVPKRRHADILTYEEIVAFTEAAVATGVSRVRITGGEPLVRRDCAELVAKLAALDGIRDLSLTTNGSLLARHAGELAAAGLDRVNVSIDSLEAARFRRVTRGGGLEPVLAGLEAALAAGLAPVKVNTVLLAGIEREVDSFLALARSLPVHVRFIEVMPVGRRAAAGVVTAAEMMRLLADRGDLRPVAAPEGGGPARYFRLGRMRGSIGIIGGAGGGFCSDCSRLRLTADGRLRSCLFSGSEVDVRPLIGRGPALRQTIAAAIAAKRYDRHAEHPPTTPRTMSQIGG